MSSLVKRPSFAPSSSSSSKRQKIIFTLTSIKTGGRIAKDEKQRILNQPVAVNAKLHLCTKTHLFSSINKINQFEYYVKNENTSEEMKIVCSKRSNKDEYYKLAIPPEKPGELIVKNKNTDIPVDIYFHDIKLKGVYIYRSDSKSKNAATNRTWDEINQFAKVHNNMHKKYIYDLNQKLGSGGQGTVHKCYKLAEGETCAMKIYDNLKPSHKDRIMKTIALQQGLACNVPGIPKIEDHFVEQGLTKQVRKGQNQIVTIQYTRIYEVQEYIEGCDLFDAICNNQFNWYDGEGVVKNEKAILDFFMQLVNILNDMHSNNMMHRDIKPENIMIRKDGTVYLVDFGFARENTDVSKAKTIVHTPAYVAPEVQVAVYGRTYTTAADIYSLGMVLFVTLFNCIPLAGTNWHSPQRREIMVYNKKNISHRGKDIIESMLKYEAKERPTTDQIIGIINIGCNFQHFKNLERWKIEFDGKTKVYLGGRNLTDDDALAIGELLKTNNTLTTLNLRNNNITDVLSIGEGLKTNNTLKWLYLDNNNITNVQSIGEGLKTNKTLMGLYLSNNNITDDGGIQSIIDVLKTNNTLKYLYLSNNQLSDNMISQLNAIEQYKRDGSNGYQQVKGMEIWT
eukprot:g9055.t1